MSRTSYGVAYAVFAKRAEPTSESTEATYSDGVQFKSITETVTPNQANAELYGDNELAESINLSPDGSVTVNVTRMSLSAYATIFGATYTPAVTTTGNDAPERLKDNKEDVAAYVGHGYVKNIIEDGAKSFELVWLPKVKFNKPEDTVTTVSNGSVTFNTPSITGKASPDENGDWRIRESYATAAAALAALKAYAGITA